jgi:hypothetical protein
MRKRHYYGSFVRMFPALASLKEPAISEAQFFAARRVSQRQVRGKWLAILGWVLTVCGLFGALLGFSDLQNFAVVAALGLMFIPLGLLLVTGGQILVGLAAIEKNMRGNETAKEKASAGDAS